MMLNWWKKLLFPFAILYHVVTSVRNFLYDKDIIKSTLFKNINIICVGNLSVGGTGKTPMVHYLIDYLLRKKQNIVTLSRGYGRKTKGIRICSEEDSPTTVGDEPYTYFENFKEKITVCVGENRVDAIHYLLLKYPNTQVILLDDAFQHRALKSNFSILLTTQSRPFWKDYLLPFGRLRESRYGVNRCDIVVVTKCIHKCDHYPILENINKPYFQTLVQYLYPILFFGSTLKKKVVIVAGLADNTSFIRYVKRNFEVIFTISKPDHYEYSTKDMHLFKKILTEKVMLLTTQKDAVKLKRIDELANFNCAYLPIKVKFFEGEDHFLHLIDQNFD